MKILFLILLSCSAFADSDPLFTTVTLQERMGNLYRHEVASSWPHCIEHKRAEKTILHKTNELREIAVWDKDGKVRGAGKNNNPALHKEVAAIFARSQRSESNPCLKAKVVEPRPEPEPEATVEEAPVITPTPEPEKPATPKAILH